MSDIDLPFGWDSAVEEARKLNSNGTLNSMVVATSIILELDSQFRPAEPKQKTVDDAYEWANGEWLEDESWGTIWWNKIHNSFHWGDNVTDDTVCTREEFEAYGREQEAKQEGEKWTHTYIGEECYIATTYNDCAWIVRRITEDRIVPLEDLKPIKPTLTKAQESVVLDFAESIGMLQVAEQWLSNNYDITH